MIETSRQLEKDVDQRFFPKRALINKKHNRKNYFYAAATFGTEGLGGGLGLTPPRG